MIEIPPVLVDQVRQGQAVLLVGAGASFGAQTPEGMEAPSGLELGRLLSDEFLGGAYKDRPLALISELCVSESDLGTVQHFIASLLRPLVPANFHRMVATFRWHGLATTNFDLVLETAYDEEEEKVQSIAPFISDTDRVEDKVRSPDHVLLLKLHGCITRIGDERLPLILTPDQYVSHREHRNQMYEMLCQWGREKPVIFVGQDLLDSDIRQLLLILDRRAGDFRPRYFLVRPGMDDPERNLWTRRRVDVVNATFESFLRALDAAIPREIRPLLAQVRSDHPVRRHFAENAEMSDALRDALESDIEYVHGGIRVQSGKAQDFYKGFDLGWYPIAEDLDLRRGLVDTLVLDVVLADETQRPSQIEFYVVKSEAGGGKSVLLRRLAWETALEADRLTLYARGHRELRWEVLQELAALAQQRLFLIVDDVAKHVSSLERLLTEARRQGTPLTVIAGESYSLWEIYCSRLDDFVTAQFPLRNLSEDEIAQLVDLLKANESLGTRLERLSRDEQIAEFLDVADRQLLVALHEATQGEPLEVIVAREFSRIRPQAAQALYLTVCVLNRLQVGVRAGLISRVHGIPFEDFERELLGPLDHVVKARLDPIVQDYLYETRHPFIADMVFRRVLSRPEQRFKEYSHLLGEMNLAYRTDELAFDGMMKGKSIVDLFPDYEMASQLYDLAEKLAPHHGELFHQRAIFELRRANPSPDKAYAALERAWQLGRDSASITHTFAELALVQADASDSALRKEKYWERAEELASALLTHDTSGRHARHTLVKVGIARLRHALREGKTGRLLEELITSIESHLERGYQQNPNDSYLAASEADLWELLRQSDDAIAALEQGFAKNPRDTYVAVRLAKAYQARGDLEEALEVVDAGLKADRGNRRLNYRKAMILRAQGETDPSLLVYFLKRAFTPGDDNHEAQFWYARYLYELGEPEQRREAKDLFRALRRARVPYETRTAVRDIWGGSADPGQFFGSVRRLESTYGYIELDGDGDWLFVHSNDIAPEMWQRLSVGMRVKCNIGFTLNGATALEVEPG